MASSAQGSAPIGSPLGLELRALGALALPLSLTHLGNQLLSAVDTAVVGRLGEAPLAGTGLGSNLFFAVSVLGLGVMLGLDPLISQAVGANERDRAGFVFRQGIWISLLVAVPLSLLLIAVAWAMPWAGLAPDAAAETAGYLYGRIPGLWPFLWGVGARAYLTAHGSTRPLLVGVVVANLLNVPASWLLVFGDRALSQVGMAPVGLPSMGALGAGLASSLAATLMGATMIWAASVRSGGRRHQAARPDRATIRRALSLGTPLSLTLLAEVGFFGLVTLLIGQLGTRPLAAHSTAIMLASTTFQVTVAIGAATAVRVGHAVGRGDTDGTRRAGLVGIGVGTSFMLVMGILFLAIPRSLARLLSDDDQVVTAAVPLVLVAAAFQLVDGLQAVAAGALRGAGATRFPLFANLVGHYGVGLPVGVLLTFGLGWDARGLWWGLCAGLSAVAAALTARFLAITRTAVGRA